MVADAFEAIFADPSLVMEAPSLYAFRTVLIPKASGDFRPVAVQETLLTLLHRILLRQWQGTDTFKLADAQLAFRKNAAIQAAIRVNDAMRQGKVLFSLDVSNAFNTLPFDQIEDALADCRAPSDFRSYVSAFLRGRSSQELEQVTCGTPQGDPLSMALFCVAVDPIIRDIPEGELWPMRMTSSCSSTPMTQLKGSSSGSGSCMVIWDCP